MHHGSGASRWRFHLTALMALLVLGLLTACAPGQNSTDVSAERPASRTKVILASTTSTDDSGLFGELIPAFEDAFAQYDVDVIAVGTGEALEIGRKKDADVLLVHSKADEERFVAEGYGIERRDVMYNDFVIVGPPADPAGLKGTDDATAAFFRIAEERLPFASRGDDSGTHKKEITIWEAAGITTKGGWYDSIGQGMGDTLNFASEKEAYTIADRGTYLAMRDRIDLDIIVEGDRALLNPYGVIVVTDASNGEGAKAFADWIVSPSGQDVIERFGVDTFGEPLFIPSAE